MLTRYHNKVLLTPEQFRASDPRLKIVGVFNPGVAKLGDETILLVRVAEAPIEPRAGHLASPRLVIGAKEPTYEIDYFKSLSDNGEPTQIGHNRVRLPHISHFQIARLKSDGYTLHTLATHPELFGQGADEEFGIEDPRITEIEGVFYITYVTVSRTLNVSTSLMSTRDFKSFKRHGVIFACENKDVILHPQKFGGRFFCYHRPVGTMLFYAPSMVSASSANLTDWGGHKSFLLPGEPGTWDATRIGGGTPAIKTREGWLQIYHGVGPGQTTNAEGKRPREYCAGAILTSLNDPSTVLKKSIAPILKPEKDFEINGYISRVVFPTGWLPEGGNPDRMVLYYGCADTDIAAVTVSVDEILGAL